MLSVVIAGGTGGLGGAVTARLLAEGYRCVVPYRDEGAAQALRAQLGDDGQRLILLRADLSDPPQAAEAVAQADDATAPLHAAINLIGGFAAPGRVHEAPIESFEAQLRLNLRPTYLLCSAALARMRKRREGVIVCVSSRAARRPFAGAAGYITAKAALLAFVEALVSEYEREGIRVNALLPGVIDTPANRAADPHADRSGWSTPEQIAAVIAFLCSDQASCVSGAQLPV
ncbi:MAG TPA: SDR family NAD(P)-dependent oxidoreductase [Solirubrobacteraceae bacterium]|nr:SDR family NAD(P)-dependent oxidoreductase [Solirubrobacteraceae bacterium]